MKRPRRAAPFVAVVALVCTFGAGCWASAASAALIAIDHYDINDAVMSGHGNWFHVYGGAITPGVAFVNNGFPGSTALYQFGSGTLNDGVIGTSEAVTQLFVTPNASDGTPINPAIFLTLDFITGGPWLVNRIEIYGGDIANGIPGVITGVSVGLIGPTGGALNTPFTTTPFNSVDDLVDLTGSGLELTPADAVVLSGFQGALANWFSITEIRVFGDQAPSGVPVPEPATLALLGLGLAGLGFSRRKL